MQTVFWYRKAKKNRIRSLFPFEFSTKLEARTELMGIWILATVLYGNLLGSALLFSPQNCQHKITQNRVCNAFWWVFEWFSVIVITLEHVGHILLRSNPICSRSDVANRKSSYRLLLICNFGIKWGSLIRELFKRFFRQIPTPRAESTHLYRNSMLFESISWIRKCLYCAKNP